MQKIFRSIKKNYIGIILMLCSSVCVCFGQLLWKLSSVESSLFYLVFGFALYALGAIFMFVAYRFGSVSLLQPILGMNYVLALILAHFVLCEPVTALKICGVILITFSVILIGGSDD